MQIYVLINGEQQGPFTVDQLKGYLAMGQFQHADMAWREGMADWKPLGEFPEFPAKTHRTPNYRNVAIRKVAPKKSQRGKNIMATVSFLLVLAAAGGGGYYFWQQYQAKHSGVNGAPPAPTDSDYASGKPGIPKTLDELNKWYEEPPAGQNAAEYFQKGFDALQITDADQNSKALPLFGKAPLPAPSLPVPAAMKLALKSFLEQNQPALEQFEHAVPCSGSRYPIDLARGYGIPVPHLRKLKEANQLALLYTLSQADARDAADATRGVLLTLASAESLRFEPLLLSQLEHAAGESFAAEALEQTVNRVALPAESLAQLQNAFDHAAADEMTGTACNRAFVGDRVIGSVMIEMSPEQFREAILTGRGANAIQDWFGQTPEKVFADSKKQRKFYEETMDQVLAARKEPFPTRLSADDLLASRAGEAKAKPYLLAALALDPASSGPTNGASNAPPVRIASREASGLAHLRLAQTGIALERFRADNTNRYPATLTELAPKYMGAVPADPFDGQPLRYQKGTQGYLLHSIGADLKDDGGMRKPGSDDLFFSVARPPRAS